MDRKVPVCCDSSFAPEIPLIESAPWETAGRSLFATNPKSNSRIRYKGVKGNDQEHAFLTNAGFVTTDADGDVYYVGPLGHIVWLYSEGEWCADKAPAACTSLEEYVVSVKEALEHY